MTWPSLSEINCHRDRQLRRILCLPMMCWDLMISSLGKRPLFSPAPSSGTLPATGKPRCASKLGPEIFYAAASCRPCLAGPIVTTTKVTSETHKLPRCWPTRSDDENGDVMNDDVDDDEVGGRKLEPTEMGLWTSGARLLLHYPSSSVGLFEGETNLTKWKERKMFVSI